MALEVSQIINKASFKQAIELYNNGHVEKAIRHLQDQKIEADKLAYKHFLISKYAFDISFFDIARANINKAIEFKVPLQDYAYFMKGMIEWESKNDLELAEKSFLKALEKKPIRSLELDTQFHLSRLYFYQERFPEAKKVLTQLRKAYRFSPRRPEVLWKLTQIYVMEDDRLNTCRWARNLYSNYPFSSFVSHWTMNLAENKVGNRSLNCLPNYNDQKRRIKKLLWSGKDKEAARDIKILQKISTPENKNDMVSLHAEYLLHIGDVDEAVTLLLKNYKAQKNDFEYLMLLGFATFKASHFQTAVGSYYKAYQLKPKHRKGKTALYRSAFLSYQFQDYDGATRKYKEFIKVYPYSSLARDAKYHIAWMRYLKGNYTGAIASFEEILTDRKNKKRRWRKYSIQRIQYWMAMSYLKLNKKKTAAYIFDHLSRDPMKGYYSFTASSRLQSLGPLPVYQNPSESGLDRGLSSEDEKALTNPDMNRALAGAHLTDHLENQNQLEEDSVEVAKRDEVTPSKDFWSLPKVNYHLSRVEPLIEMGQMNWAYRDIKQIERHIKDKSLYPKFVKNYELLEQYTRSSYLAEVKVLPVHELPLEESKNIWRSAFPRPYKGAVKQFSKDFAVPDHFVWSIMKAESRYNRKAESPVGAKGLMQLMPYTAKKVARLIDKGPQKDLFLHNPQTNIKLGTRYLSRLLGKFNNQLPLVAAAYNAGPHRVWSWLAKFGKLDLDEFIEHIPFLETRNYVKRVTRFYGAYNFTYNNKPDSLSFLASSIPIEFNGPSPTKEDWN